MSLSVVAALFVGGCGRSPSGAGGPLEVLATLGEVGLSPGQFAYPRAIDSDGRDLWVIDKAARVQRVEPATGDCLAGWTMPDSELGKPTGVTVGPDGLIYIPDTHYHRVMVYRPPTGADAPPELVGRFGEYGSGPGQFIYPTDVAISTGSAGEINRIYVAEYGGNDRVQVFDGSFRFLFAFGTIGRGDDPAAVEFSRPQSLAIIGDALIVADACNHRLGRFTLDGSLVGWIGSPETAGDAPGRFSYPYGLCALADGTLLVSEFGNNRVQRIDPATGRSLAVYGRAGRGEGELAGPWGITVIGDRAYALDSGNNRVLAFPSPVAAPRREAGR